MKNNNLRKGIMIASSLILAAAISVGATLAYLTDTTNTKTNTFTAGDGITIQLLEPKYKFGQNQAVMPGQTFDKDPEVKNTSTNSPVYTVMSLEYKIDGDSVPYTTFVAAANAKHVTIKSGGTPGFNSAWTQLTDTDDNLDYFVYGTSKSALTPVGVGVETAKIFDTVTISEKDTGGTYYEIIANAYAVNADGGVTADVFTELASLTNNKISKASGNAFN